MDFSLDDEQSLIVSTIRRLVQQQIDDWAAEADRAGAPPERLFDVAGELGFFVDAVPEEAGGMLEESYDHVTRALRGIELGRGCAGLAALLETNVEPSLAVAAWGSAAAKGSLFGSLGDGGMAATAADFYRRLSVEDAGGGLVISGALGPVPALASAAHLLLCARAGDEPVLVLVPTGDLAGDSTIDEVVPSGWRAGLWGILTAERLEVPEDFVLARGAEADGAIAEVLSWCRVSLAARAVGASRAAMDHARAYAEERVQFGQPIGRFESIIGLRDESETATAAARTLALEAAWKLDTGAPDAFDAASRAREFACRTLARASIDAVQILGGYGFVNDYPVEKIMRDARPYETLLGNEGLRRVLEAKEVA